MRNLLTNKHRKTCKWHRYNALEYTEILDELYSNTIATGSKAVTITCPQTNTTGSQIDPFLDSSTAAASASSQGSTLAPPVRNRQRGTTWQDKVEGKTHKARLGETYEPIDKVLDGLRVLANSRRHHLTVVVKLLETEYKDRLTEEHFDIALDFLMNETHAIYFTSMSDKERRDHWLMRKSGVIVIRSKSH